MACPVTLMLYYCHPKELGRFGLSSDLYPLLLPPQEFLAAESRLAEELTRRTAVEVALREAEVAKRKEEEERAR